MFTSLRRGSLAPVRHGMTKLEVAEALGEPWDRTPTDGERDPQAFDCWKYGDLRLTFSGDVLTFIVVYVDGKGSLEVPGEVDLGLLGGAPPSRPAILERLRQEQLGFETDERLTFPGQVAYVVERQTSLVFDEEEDLLQGISYLAEGAREGAG